MQNSTMLCVGVRLRFAFSRHGRLAPTAQAKTFPPRQRQYVARWNGLFCALPPRAGGQDEHGQYPGNKTDSALNVAHGSLLGRRIECVDPFRLMDGECICCPLRSTSGQGPVVTRHRPNDCLGSAILGKNEDGRPVAPDAQEPAVAASLHS